MAIAFVLSFCRNRSPSSWTKTKPPFATGSPWRCESQAWRGSTRPMHAPRRLRLMSAIVEADFRKRHGCAPTQWVVGRTPWSRLCIRKIRPTASPLLDTTSSWRALNATRAMVPTARALRTKATFSPARCISTSTSPLRNLAELSAAFTEHAFSEAGAMLEHQKGFVPLAVDERRVQRCVFE